MAVGITVQGVDVTFSKTRLVCKLALTGSYSTGGDTVNFTTVIGTADGPEMFLANSAPINGDVAFSTAAGSGYQASFIPGTTLSNGLLKIVVTSTGAEVAAGAYASALTGDGNITGEFIFEKLQ